MAEEAYVTHVGDKRVARAGIVSGRRDYRSATLSARRKAREGGEETREVSVDFAAAKRAR